MRPIDADDLREAMEFCKTISHMKNNVPLIDEFIGAIDDMPTIDAAPVRRSEWVTDDDSTDDWAEPYCKKCGCFIPHGPAHFCPNCGADMRGETHGTD